MCKPTKNMKTYTIYMKYEQIDFLSVLSAKTRIPQAAYIREAIDLLRAKYADVINQEADKIIVVKN